MSTEDVLLKIKRDVLTPAEWEALRFSWRHLARRKQLPPDDDEWVALVVMAGRGFGKNWMAANMLHEFIRTGKVSNAGVIARTTSDMRDVAVEGVSGILNTGWPDFRPTWEPTKHKLTWPNGGTATAYSADEPDRLRGPEHDFLWMDELSAWRFATETYRNALLTMRKGASRYLVTMTPKPTMLVRDIVRRCKEDPLHFRLVTGSTYENRANLSPNFLEFVTTQYEGSYIGRQEIYAELLEQREGALWQRAWLDKGRVVTVPPLKSIVIGVDPSGGAAETGIIVLGVDARGEGYVIGDYSTRGSPAQWANAVARAWHEHGVAAVGGYVAAEGNFGGDMVIATIQTADPDMVVKKVTASRGKDIRAEPVASLFEQQRIHLHGNFPELEDELCNWTREDSGSPNRLDALAIAGNALMVKLHEKRYGQYGPDGYGILCSGCMNFIRDCTCPNRRRGR